MKTVDLMQDLHPWRKGDAVHLPDAVAEKLVADGEAENLRPFAVDGVEVYENKAMRAEEPTGYKTRAKRSN